MSDNGKWVDGRWYPKSPPVTDEDLARHERQIQRPIREEAAGEAGYRCDDCDFWWADVHRGHNNGGGRIHLLRYGCPKCKSKSLTAERGYYHQRCGDLIGQADWYEHLQDCLERET